MTMLSEYSEFLADPNAWDMYITGPAGTGKTTSLAQLVENTPGECVVTAFTHKACGILRSKLPPNTKIKTLHSFLSKRPTVNQNAAILKHIDSNTRVGGVDDTKVLFIDEFSMVGEKDLMDLREVQENIETEVPNFKIVWIGDLNQLPPVGDMQTVNPHGKYWVKLTKVHRQAADNPLMKPLQQLVSFIEKRAPVEPLVESNKFIRGANLVEKYVPENDSIILAYTNKRVQEFNFKIQGRDYPEVDDKLFSPSVKREYTVNAVGMFKPNGINKPFNGEELELGTKYRTLEFLHTMDDIQYGLFENEQGNEECFAFVFGTYNYITRLRELKEAAAQSNADIAEEYSEPPAAWARANPQHPLARARSVAWREFLTFNECVICLDFNHAMTVHKSQGSTYETVLVDMQDIGFVADRDYDLYLKLLYVAISRASDKVIAN